MMVPMPRKILIVDDHDATRRGLQEFLANAGYVVLSASTFDEGKRLLREQAPDLLIADVRLGDFNGLQLVIDAPALPSIIVTGFPDPIIQAEAVRLGAHFLTNPIAPHQWPALIETPPASCPQCGSPDADPVAPRPYQPQSTRYHCRACGRIWSVPKPPTIPD